MIAGEVPTRSAVGRLSHFDASMRARLGAACGFMNDEIEKAVKTIVGAAVVCVILGLSASVLLWILGNREHWMLPPILAVVIVVFFIRHQRASLATTYKQVVIGRIVAALGQGLTYSAGSRLQIGDFVGLHLFSRPVGHWRSEDEICGRKGAISYSICEANATESKKNEKQPWKDLIFAGLIVRLDFNKHFQGHTIVIPNGESQVLDGVLGESQTRGGKTLCRMDDALFEKSFSVYSTNSQEAHYILTPKLMELILATHARFNGTRCCFKDQSVHLAIPSKGNRFEVSLLGPKMTPENAIGDLAECVDLAEQLIDALHLETRIWSKV